VGRIIFHLDMDAYFASIEQQVDPTLRGRPIGVTGRPTERSIVVAFSREAKRFDVWTGMPVWEARRACRSLRFVPGRPERYVETTKRFLAILKRYTPMIEVFSTDEVFMDMTQEIDRYGGAIALAEQIKSRFREELGPCITSTIGIASNKTFAKLVAKRHKPDGLGYLPEDDLPKLLRTTSVAEVCGIGPRIERRLSQMGVRTLAELGELPTSLLKREFGVYGLFLKGVGVGIDPSPVIPYSDVPPPKSIGHSRSLPPQLRTYSLALLVLRDLCDKVARRMRKLGYVGRTVHCGFRLGPTGPYHGKQTTLSTPTDDGEQIYRACLDILDEIPTRPETVHHVGVSVENLIPHHEAPIALFEMDHRQEMLNRTIDCIRDRYGERAIRIGTSLLYQAIPRHVSGFVLDQMGHRDVYGDQYGEDSPIG